MTMLANKYKGFNTNEKTPKALYDALNKEFCFSFDPCPLNASFDGLSIDWKGSIFINPPYGRAIPVWLNKGLSELEKGNASLLCYLLPAYPDVRWFHEIVLPKAKEIRFLKGRLRFGEHNNNAPFASMVIIFKMEGA